ncbi:hypothetical protein AYO20_07437 [Fonsecaea nubica]|uniref:Uncharacterized protein n=1 Tax=Fonsecaea nubica TaxID=856822 RepID=A0A178CWI2_9EURO|nr:hypothetical protein AYO20_07437 [Fonsecaea nubica]OAL33275.1 hypothetical protein AYO20_07437 [Fonsecaea nubica]
MAAYQEVVSDLSCRYNFDSHTDAESSCTASSVVSAENLYRVASEAQTRVKQEFEPATIPASAASSGATSFALHSHQLLGWKTRGDQPRIPLFCINAQGWDCPLTTLLDTGANVTVARFSVAQRGNMRIFPLDRPVPLLKFDGEEKSSHQYAWVLLRMQCRPHRPRWARVYLLEDKYLPFADAHLGYRNAVELGLQVCLRED